MFRFCLAALCVLLTSPVWAMVNIEPLLNKITMQLHAEQWVTTKTALVTVSVNAAVSGQGLDRIQNNVLQKLQQMSNQGEWHIIAFNRQLDKTGLESVQINAQARLPQTELASIRDKAKNVSRPGETFTVESVQFTPSNEELQQANAMLRNNLYLQAKGELDGLNKIYPDQKYYLHEIDFTSAPVPMPQNTMMLKVASPVPQGSTLSVGNKLMLDATVVLGSMNEQSKQKLAGSSL